MSVLLQVFRHISEHFTCSYPREISPTIFCELVHLAYGVTVENLVVADGNQLVTVIVYDKNGNVVASASDTINSYASRMISSDVLFEQVAKFTTSAYAHFH